MSDGRTLSPADLAELSAAGIDAAEALHQLAFLENPPARLRLLRPATAGDGVLRLPPEREEELVERGRAARDAGRLTKFVPASGAATRMFRAVLGREAADAQETAATLAALPGTAIGREIARRAGTTPLADWFLSSEGQAFAALPKALLPFHLEDGTLRTAFDDQIAEGLWYLTDRDGRTRFHFTVPAEFRSEFTAVRTQWRERVGAGLEIGFSEQLPSTRAIALDPSGAVARQADGRLLLRPSGHGALLDNLARLGDDGADLVLIKNIDNILPPSRHREIARTRLLLLGVLLEREERRTDRSRPLRACAVVANSGEPGGGPFWVAGKDGRPSLQIVESAEVNLADDDQAAIWQGSTHFNPVDLAVSLRAADGRPFDLRRFVDPDRAFVAGKSEGPRRLRVYERPGLWNGAMADWETIFVELPAWTFAPVKTLLDLARPEHRVAAPSD
ncbi:MAG: DUF4301 family protein [Thermoanaerobaculia bacterium]